MISEQTIYALASGKGRSGVAVIRVSGARAGDAAIALAGRLPPPRTVAVRQIRAPRSSDVLDEGLVIWFPAPGSFTGEDIAEFHVHGSPAVVAAVLGVLAEQPGLRPAEPGEFTRRAFGNGRMDLVQVEGLGDLIEAETEAQRRQAVRQMSGSVARRYEDWRAELLHCLAYFEAEIDFADEADVPDDVSRGMQEKLAALKDGIEAQLDDARRGERLRGGLRVVIAGRPNVGKSSLLNCLAERDVAIVSEHAGTTRDVIEVHLDLNGFPVTLADTAGLREARDEVEREGVERARLRLSEADLVLWVIDPDDLDHGPGIDGLGDTGFLGVLNKSDLMTDAGAAVKAMSGARTWLAVSARTGAGIGGLIAALSDWAGELFSGTEEPLITRERHRKALIDCSGHIAAALAGWDGEAELVAEDLRMAARALGRVTGRVDVEDLLDVIFRDFCIGK